MESRAVNRMVVSKDRGDDRIETGGRQLALLHPPRHRDLEDFF
jgi:hypothetical protein